VSYVYRHVDIIRVLDGDTVELDIDLGNKTRWRDKFRLMGIDTPERGQAGHKEATVHLIDLLGNTLSHIETHKPDKYGRWLVDLYITTKQGGTLHVNKLMVLDGHAKEYFGGKKE
jgi:micrococcal nuclease